MALEIRAEVARGPKRGTMLVPHRYARGYVVSPTRFARDQKYVGTLEEVVEAVEAGLSVRMSCPDRRSPSLIAPSSIHIIR